MKADFNIGGLKNTLSSVKDALRHFYTPDIHGRKLRLAYDNSN